MMADKKIELRPCPHCGEKAISCYGLNGFYITCSKICVSPGDFTFKEEAVEIWNRREGETFFEKFFSKPENQKAYMQEKARVEFEVVQAKYNDLKFIIEEIMDKSIDATHELRGINPSPTINRIMKLTTRIWQISEDAVEGRKAEEENKDGSK